MSLGILFILAVVGMVVVSLLFLGIWISHYRKVGPNQVLIISGRLSRYVAPDGTVRTRGFRVVKGGGTFVLPLVEKTDVLSLEVLTTDVQASKVHTKKGALVTVDGVAQIKVPGDDTSIEAAAEHFLSKGAEAMRRTASQTLEGHLRTLLGTLTVEEINENRDALASGAREMAAGELATMGLSIVNFTIRDIRESQGKTTTAEQPI